MVVACSETLLNASNSSLVEMSIFCEKSLEESPVTVGLRLVFQALIQYSLAFLVSSLAKQFHRTPFTIRFATYKSEGLSSLLWQIIR